METLAVAWAIAFVGFVLDFKGGPNWLTVILGALSFFVLIGLTVATLVNVVS